jgi:hypothetical protein
MFFKIIPPLLGLFFHSVGAMEVSQQDCVGDAMFPLGEIDPIRIDKRGFLYFEENGCPMGFPIEDIKDCIFPEGPITVKAPLEYIEVLLIHFPEAGIFKDDSNENRRTFRTNLDSLLGLSQKSGLEFLVTELHRAKDARWITICPISSVKKP